MRGGMRKLEHILCIDDETDILEVAKMALEMVGGLRVSCLDQSREAVETAKALQPDLILIDVMMPQMDGPSTLAALQADPASRHIPVVFMTARVQPAEVDAYLALGAAGVVPKPFDPMTLSTQIGAIWEQAAHG